MGVSVFELFDIHMERELGAIFKGIFRDEKNKIQLVFFPSKRLEKQKSKIIIIRDEINDLSKA